MCDSTVCDMSRVLQSMTKAVKKTTKQRDDVLAADYSYFILLNEFMRGSQLDLKVKLADFLKNLSAALGSYTQDRQKRLDLFRKELAALGERRKGVKKKTVFPPISVESFNAVVSHYEMDAAKRLGKALTKLDEMDEFGEDDQGSQIDDNDEERTEYVQELLWCLHHFNAEKWCEHLKDAQLEEQVLQCRFKVLEQLRDPETFANSKKDALENNETFAIVDDLIVKPTAQSLDGRMKIVRVTATEHGNVFYTTLCLARQIASKNNDFYTFELIRDFGNFCLEDFQSSAGGDAELIKQDMVYRVRRVLQQDKCQHEDAQVEACGCREYKPKEQQLRCQCGHEHTMIRTYKDLNKLPCLLILQRKGRLGDTFPMSFNCMDLRLGYTNDVRRANCVQWNIL